jgi:hypothetical protein
VGPEEAALRPAILAAPWRVPHLYGKVEARRRGKMGHVTRRFPPWFTAWYLRDGGGARRGCAARRKLRPNSARNNELGGSLHTISIRTGDGWKGNRNQLCSFTELWNDKIAVRGERRTADARGCKRIAAITAALNRIADFGRDFAMQRSLQRNVRCRRASSPSACLPSKPNFAAEITYGCGSNAEPGHRTRTTRLTIEAFGGNVQA